MGTRRMMAGTVCAAVLLAFSSAAGAATAKPAIALQRTGTANCAKVLAPGWEIAFAARVTGGHSICVTHLGERSAVYFDGRNGGNDFGPNGPTFFGGIGTVRGRLVVFGDLPPTAKSVRLIFCDGKTTVIRPLNDEFPQYVGAIVNEKYGVPSQQPADDKGVPLYADQDAQRRACLSSPPTTRART